MRASHHLSPAGRPGLIVPPVPAGRGHRRLPTRLRSPGPGATCLAALLVLAGCSSGSEPVIPAAGPRMRVVQGDAQRVPAGQAVPTALGVRLLDPQGSGVGPGVPVAWTILSGAGSLSADTSMTDVNSVATVGLTTDAAAGGNRVRAVYPGIDSVEFHATGSGSFSIAAGGNNVPERFGSDLWLADGYGYSGTWYGPRVNGGQSGNAVKIWQLSAGGAPILVDSIVTPTILDVSDLEVSPDGHWLVFTAEGGSDAGVLVYELTAPANPVFRAKFNAPSGFHTGTLSVIGGVLYLFAAENPGGNGPALTILDLSQAATGTITLVSRTGVPANYGLHDTFVRDGICFAFVWNAGVFIYDVGNGVAGGSLASPVKVGSVVTSGGEAHNGWWFWNPTNGEKRYLFVGQEGPGSIGASSTGDIHVVDVSNLAAPVEVATFRLAGAGAHNFWMDEANQRLYAAFYNGGVVALDVSGTLSGDLSNRTIAQIKPAGAGNTYVWGVMLYNGSLYANDMLSGFWQLGLP